MKLIRQSSLSIVLLSVCCTILPCAFSQSYQDEFNTFREKDWDRWGEFSIWKVENGYLKNWIQGRPGLIGGPEATIELFQFKGLPGPYENLDIEVGIDDVVQRQIKKPGLDDFRITVKNIVAKRVNFGIALGWVSNLRGKVPFYYLFLMNYIINARFSGWHVSEINSSRLKELQEGLNKFWDTDELESMEVRFNSGRFQWFANGEKRADFVDPNYSPIEIFGIVVLGDDINVGHAWVDSFKIAGPGLSVSPQARLATTWGQLKQNE